MEQHTFKEVDICGNTKNTFYLSDVKSIQYLFTFSPLEKRRHLWQLKTVIFHHRCLMCEAPWVHLKAFFVIF